ncbi:hypothetical protein ACG2LH_08970 [Zhouia sp. PK063]|uniref:hypothetical protein n=1 Tax=Zhouia sp. PK063 TaxID=3373602 RepID=UPI0037967B8F
MNLDNLHNKSGFKIPKDYFQSLEEGLLTKLSEEKLPKKSGFKTPNGYFKQLENRILKQTTHKPKVIALYKKAWYAVAATAAIIIAFLGYQNYTISKSSTDIASTEIMQYVNEGYINIDSDDIMALFDTQDLQNVNLTSNNLKDSDIIDYLNDNIDDAYEQLALDDNN